MCVCVCVYAYKFSKNIFHILNCHQCGASELRQVVMVATSS